MGSFIARSYVTQYHDIDMLIAIGTAHKSRLEIMFNKFLMRFNLFAKRGKRPGKFFHRVLYLRLAKPFKKEQDSLA
jgi:hypothetical protein